MRSKMIVLAVGLGLTACGPKVASIEVKPNAISLTKKGEIAKVVATPKDAEGKAVEGVALSYTSTDPTVAAVDAATGAVTALKSGTTTIKAGFEKVNADVAVKVSIPATITLIPAELSLDGVGAKANIGAKVLDEKGRPVAGEVAWESAAPAIATVKNGAVTAMGVGTAQLTAMIGSVKATANVTVAPPPAVTAIEVSKKVELKVGAKPVKLAVTAKGEGGKAIANAVFTYTSENPKVATVDATGEVNAVAKGKTKLTIASGEKKATVDVTVKK
jgi:uncharacterized protein YjdB